MLTVEQFGEYLRVTGYADSSDWWVLMSEAHYYQRWCAVAGPEHVWYGVDSVSCCIRDGIRQRHGTAA